MISEDTIETQESYSQHATKETFQSIEGMHISILDCQEVLSNLLYKKGQDFLNIQIMN